MQVVVRTRGFAVNGFAVLFDGHVELAFLVIGVPQRVEKASFGCDADGGAGVVGGFALVGVDEQIAYDPSVGRAGSGRKTQAHLFVIGDDQNWVSGSDGATFNDFGKLAALAVQALGQVVINSRDRAAGFSRFDNFQQCVTNAKLCAGFEFVQADIFGEKIGAEF